MRWGEQDGEGEEEKGEEEEDTHLVCSCRYVFFLFCLARFFFVVLDVLSFIYLSKSLVVTLTFLLFMQVIHPRAALLSNVEVLALLRELDADHIARAKSAIRIKKEEDTSGKPSLEPHIEDISENLRTVALEVSRARPPARKTA